MSVPINIDFQINSILQELNNILLRKPNSDLIEICLDKNNPLTCIHIYININDNSVTFILNTINYRKTYSPITFYTNTGYLFVDDNFKFFLLSFMIEYYNSNNTNYFYQNQYYNPPNNYLYPPVHALPYSYYPKLSKTPQASAAPVVATGTLQPEQQPGQLLQGQQVQQVQQVQQGLPGLQQGQNVFYNFPQPAARLPTTPLPRVLPTIPAQRQLPAPAAPGTTTPVTTPLPAAPAVAIAEALPAAPAPPAAVAAAPAPQQPQIPTEIDEILKKFFSNISNYEEGEEQDEDYYGFLYENLDNYEEVANLFRYAFHLYLSNLIVELSNVNDSNKYLQTFKNMDVLNEHKNDFIDFFLKFDIQDIEKNFGITIKQKYKDEQMEEKKRKEKKQEDILKIITSYPAITDINTYDGFLYNYVKKNKKEESVKKFKQILSLYICDLIYYNINYKSSNDYIFKRNEEINDYYKKIQKYTGNNIDMIISLFLDLTKDNLKVII
jgi:hypothetical protein